MDDNASPELNPWSSLSTVNTFDRGNDTWTTRRMDEDAEVQAGGQVVGRVSPSTSLLIESLIQQLCTMFEGDAVRRNKLYYAICDKLHEMKLIDGSYNMGEFEMIRGQYQRALYHLVTVARASTGSESALQVPSCLTAEWSRYRREFQEMGFIAAGGFGNVFKARHRLDGIEYAVKKIVVRSGRVKTIMQHLGEVKTLARLNHANIVPYKGAWIEPTVPTTFVPSLPPRGLGQSEIQISEKISRTRSRRTRRNERINGNHHPESTDRNRRSSEGGESGRVGNIFARTRIEESFSNENEISYSTHSDVHVNLTKNGLRRGSEGNYKASNDIIAERFHELNSTTNLIGERIVDSHNSRVLERSYSSVVSFRNDPENSRNNNEESRKSITEEMNSGCDSEDSESCEGSVADQMICKYNSTVYNQFATLYIQMSLCEKTLRQWLDMRNEVTPQAHITSIVTQILCGLEYIHSRGIVHHDIKPSNIFISLTGHLHVQLGDFGLACPLQREDHHTVLGTHMYAAPEQLRGECNPKSDVYSLGIVLLELLVPMQTSMERSRIVAALKAGQIPTTLTVNHSKWAQVMSQMVKKDPHARPSTKQLLEDLSEDKDFTIAKLKDDNDKKSNLIEELQNQLAQQEAEIARLKNLLGNT